MKPSSLHLSISAAAAARASSARGRWYPFVFVAGFLVVIAVNGVLIATAIRSFSGLETESAYQEGLTYNATIAAAQAQESLGWQVKFDIAPRPGADAGGRAVDVTATFADRYGKPLSNRAVDVHFKRPVQAGHDVDTTLASQGRGIYGARVKIPLSGQWEVTVVAHYRATDGADKTWQTTRRIYLP